jgi:hypothetical protein
VRTRVRTLNTNWRTNGTHARVAARLHLPQGKSGAGGDCTDAQDAYWRAKFNFNIIDNVEVPKGLPVGEYALSFRSVAAWRRELHHLHHPSVSPGMNQTGT